MDSEINEKFHELNAKLFAMLKEQATKPKLTSDQKSLATLIRSLTKSLRILNKCMEVMLLKMDQFLENDTYSNQTAVVVATENKQIASYFVSILKQMREMCNEIETGQQNHQYPTNSTLKEKLDGIRNTMISHESTVRQIEEFGGLFYDVQSELNQHGICNFANNDENETLASTTSDISGNNIMSSSLLAE